MSNNETTFDVYIAIPYTHESKAVETARYNRATEYLAQLTLEGVSAFSPITHSHPLRDYGVSGTYDAWHAIDRRILRNCSAVHVLTEPGWKESKGVTDEIAHAKANGVPVVYVDPSVLTSTGQV